MKVNFFKFVSRFISIKTFALFTVVFLLLSLNVFADSLPMQGSDVAVAWDGLYWFLVWISVFFFVLVVGGMVYFAIKYKERPGIKTKYILDNHKLEAFWTLVPTILLLVIFAWGWKVYTRMVRAPSNAYQIRVIGKQWQWEFQYEDGRVSNDKIFVPVGKPVKLVMTSKDVIHSFFVPNFRIKQDVVPGMITTVWFEAKYPGANQVFCTEYCGTLHSGMLAKIYALKEEDWNLFLRGKEIKLADTEQVDQVATSNSSVLKNMTLPDQGKHFVTKIGCNACHTDNGNPGIGPSFKGIYGKKVELTDGSQVTVDEAYIYESITKPQAKKVKGFNPVMQAYQGVVTDEQITAITAYIKSLK